MLLRKKGRKETFGPCLGSACALICLSKPFSRLLQWIGGKRGKETDTGTLILDCRGWRINGIGGLFVICLSRKHSCFPSSIPPGFFLATIETAISSRIRIWVLECQESAATVPTQHVEQLQILIFTHSCHFIIYFLETCAKYACLANHPSFVQKKDNINFSRGLSKIKNACVSLSSFPLGRVTHLST